MNYEMLSFEKQRMLLDLAGRAIALRPALADSSPQEELNDKIACLAKTLAASIKEPYASEKTY
jgi:hypothetical protein